MRERNQTECKRNGDVWRERVVLCPAVGCRKLIWRLQEGPDTAVCKDQEVGQIVHANERARDSKAG